MFKKMLVGGIAACAFALPAAAQDAYLVGITAALTGPPSSTYAPAVDALRIYVDRVNAAGGVNGKQIKLVIEDDGAQPSKAAANTKKLFAHKIFLISPPVDWFWVKTASGVSRFCNP